MRFIFIFFFSLLSAYDGPQLVRHVQTSIANAEKLASKLNKEVLEIEGMSSPKVRHFLNNLSSLPQANYFEIGCYKGSTLIASLFGNQDTISSAVAIDNWSEFGWHKEEFQKNCMNFLSLNAYTFYEDDCFSIEPKSVCSHPVDIFFYDADHTELSQELAFTHYNEVFADLFIAVIDDWNHPPVRLGTAAAFKKLGYEVLFEIVLPAKKNADIENWWNGLYVSVLKKP
jgi:hypothetical protein